MNLRTLCIYYIYNVRNVTRGVKGKVFYWEYLLPIIQIDFCTGCNTNIPALKTSVCKSFQRVFTQK